MSIKPVSPSVAYAAPNIDAYIQRINNYLSTPWSSYEQMSGRWFDTNIFHTTADIESVMSVFRAAGWRVELSSCQRDGSALVFYPQRNST